MQKFNNLLVVVDTLTKQVHLVPTTIDVTAEGVAQLYFDNIYKLHGLPRGIISDRVKKFTGAFWKALQKMVGTELMMSSWNSKSDQLFWLGCLRREVFKLTR